MDDTTFSALAERALAYPVVQRRSQMSKIAFRAWQESGCVGRNARVRPCEIYACFGETDSREEREGVGSVRAFA